MNLNSMHGTAVPVQWTSVTGGEAFSDELEGTGMRMAVRQYRMRIKTVSIKPIYSSLLDLFVVLSAKR